MSRIRIDYYRPNAFGRCYDEFDIEDELARDLFAVFPNASHSENQFIAIQSTNGRWIIVQRDNIHTINVYTSNGDKK